MTAPALSAASFDAVCRLLHEHAGLSFDGSRRDPLRSAVLARIAALGCPDGVAYLDHVSRPEGAGELQALVDQVTVQETSFFRNPPQIRALRRYVLPDLLRGLREDGRERLHVWSAGCASGEEAYTVAILARELLGDQADRLVRIAGTDISARALEAARTGTYRARALQLADPIDLGRWFRRTDDVPATYTVNDEVRALVEFTQHNLVGDPPPFRAGEVDLLLCRNVMIYLAPERVRALVQRLQSCLRPGGYLLLGHAETLWQLDVDLHLVTLGDAFVYRRPLPGPERRGVLPDRRTEDEGAPVGVPERRRHDRRGGGTPSAGAGVRGLAAAVRAALDGDRPDEALRLADLLTDRSPLWSYPHYLTGLALRRLGRDADALTSLRKAVYLDPQDGLAQYALAETLARVGEPVAASRAYRAAARALSANVPVGVPLPAPAADPAGLAALCRRLAEEPSAR